MVDEVNPTRLAAILDETASEILRQANCPGPMVDAVRVARRIGLTVARDRQLNGRARFARIAVGRGRGRGAIFVGEADRPERMQWAVAHELGEISIQRVLAELDVPPEQQPPGTREHLANELARRILLPKGRFQAAGRRCGWDLSALKEVFPTASHELLARRMLDFPPPTIITVCDHGQVSWRRTNQTGSAPPLNPQERLLARVAHETGHYQEQEVGGLSIRAWPIHEPAWKREILRTAPLHE